MKKAVVFILISLIAGLAAFCWVRSYKMAAHTPILLDSMPELSWMKSDLKLSDAQFAKVSELHAAYRPKCTEMCGRISKAHEKMDELIREHPEVTPALENAIREHAATHADCQQEMLKHLFQTARVMNPDQAAHYLKAMLPFALDFSHSEAGGIHGN